jgi:hypothetical protein
MRTRLIFSVLTTLILLLISAHPATAQLPSKRPSQVTIPKSSQELPADIGHRFHTNIQILGTGPMLPTGQLSVRIRFLHWGGESGRLFRQVVDRSGGMVPFTGSRAI